MCPILSEYISWRQRHYCNYNGMDNVKAHGKPQGDEEATSRSQGLMWKQSKSDHRR